VRWAIGGTGAFPTATPTTVPTSTPTSTPFPSPLPGDDIPTVTATPSPQPDPSLDVCQDAFEPNDSQAQAQPLSFPVTQDHAFCTANDADWVRFEAAQGVAYRIETRNLLPGVDTVVSVHDATGAQLAENDEGPFPPAARFDWTSTVAGTVWVRVRPYDPTQSSPRHQYQLRIRPLTCVDAWGDNSTAALASPVSAGNQTTFAACANGTTNWIAFTGTANTFYRLELVNVPRQMFLQMQAYASDQTTPLSYLDTSTNPRDPLVVYVRPAQTGTVYLKVSVTSSITPEIPFYDLRITTDSCPDAQIEPNDQFTSARLLSPAMSYALALCGANDVDWFAVNAQAGTTYRLEGTAAAGLNPLVFSPRLRLYSDPNGAELSTGSTNSAVRTWTATQTGVYYVRIDNSRSSSLNDPSFQYILALQVNPTCPDSYESTEQAGTSPALSGGGRLLRALCEQSDEDWATVSVTQTGQYRVEVVNYPTTMAVGLWIMDSDRTTTLAFNSSGSSTYPTVGITLTAGTTYAVKVANTLSFEGDITRRYELCLTAAASCVDPYEPNATKADATLIQPGQAQTHWMVPGQDVDVLRVASELGALYRLRVTTQQPDLLFRMRMVSAGGGDEIVTSDASGTLTAVFLAGGEPTQTITLSNLLPRGGFLHTYRVLVEPIMPAQPAASTQANAVPITPGSVVTRTHQFLGQTDWYVFEGLAGLDYHVTVTTTGRDQFEFAYLLTHDAGANPRRIYVGDRAEPTVNGVQAFSYTPPQSGLIYLKLPHRGMPNALKGSIVSLAASPISQTLPPTIVLGDYTTFPEPYDTPEESPLEYATRQHFNQARLARGLAPLAFNDSLNKAARTQAFDMELHQVVVGYPNGDDQPAVGHDGTDGTTADDRAHRAGYTGGVGENGYGAPNHTVTSGIAPVNGWMGSTHGHREAMLSPWSREIGIGVAGGYAYSVFGSAPGIQPVFINSDALSTATRQVTVTLSAPDPNVYGGQGWSFALSHSPIFTPTTWTPYTITQGSFANPNTYGAPQQISFVTPLVVDWTLPPGIGEQAVYVKYRTPNGTVYLNRDTISVALPTVTDANQPVLPPALPASLNPTAQGVTAFDYPLMAGNGLMSPRGLALHVTSYLADAGRTHQGSSVGAGAALSEFAVLRLPDATPQDPSDDAYHLLWDDRLWNLTRDWSQAGEVYRLPRERVGDGFSDSITQIAHTTGAAHGIDSGAAWQITFNDGTVWAFGTTADSAWRFRDAAGTAHIWRWNVAQVTDIHTNYQRWTYATETDTRNGQPFDRAGQVSQIAWNGNVALSKQPDRAIIFEYAARGTTDSNPATNRFFTTTRLNSITVFAGSVETRRYGLGYTIVADGPANRLALTSITTYRDGTTPTEQVDLQYHAPEIAGEGVHLATVALNGGPSVAYAYTRQTVTGMLRYTKHHTLFNPTAAEVAVLTGSAGLVGASANKNSAVAAQRAVSTASGNPCADPNVDPAKVQTTTVNGAGSEHSTSDCAGNSEFGKDRTQPPYDGLPYKGGCEPAPESAGRAAESSPELAMARMTTAAATGAYCHKVVANYEAVTLPSGQPSVRTPATFEDIRQPDGSYEYRQTGTVYDQHGNVLYRDHFGVMADPSDDWYTQRTYGNPQFPDLVTATMNYDQQGTLRAKTTYAYLPGTRLLAETGQWLLEEGRILTSTLRYDARGLLASMSDPTGATTTYGYDTIGNTIALTNPLGLVSRMTYDDHGRVASQTDPRGATKTYQYDAVGNLDHSIDALDQRTTYVYDAQKRKIAAINPRGAVVGYGYNDLNQLIVMTNTLGLTTHYEYDSRGHRVTTIDPLGRRTTATYESAHGWQTASTDALSATTTMTYDGAGKIVAVTNPLQDSTSTVYDGSNRVIARTDALNNTTRTQYDSFGRMIAQTDALSATARYQYDSLSRLVVMTDTLGYATRYQYDDAGRQTAVINPRGAVSRSFYNALGQVITSTDALSQTTAFGYDVADNQTVVTDTLGIPTTRRYDLLGRMLAETNGLSQTSSYGYDAVGNQTVITDTRGFVTHRVYDPANRLVAITDALSQTTAFGYDAVGNQTVITDTRGYVTRAQFDAGNRLVASTNPLTQTSATGYDPLGRATILTSTLGLTMTSAYDAGGRMITSTDQLRRATRYDYDAVGRRTAVIDPAGVRTTFAYDAAGRLTAVIENAQAGGPADPQTNVTTRFTYDAVGNLITSIDANTRPTTHTYDLLNQRTATSDPLGRTTVLTYTARGELGLSRDALGRVTTYTYDDGGRLTLLDYPAGTPDVTYAYDAASNVTTMTDGTGTTTYTYDALSQMRTRTHAGRTLTYTYTLTGQVAALDYWSLGTVAFTYDALDRLATLQPWDGPASSYTYRGDTALPATITRGGITSAYTYTAAHELGAIDHQYLATRLNRFGYTTDAVSNRLSSSELVAGTVLTTTYGYDPLQRLRDVSYPALPGGPAASSIHYTLDAVGNRLSDGSTSATFDAADQASGMTYDGVGNLLSDGTTTYTYDAANRLLTTTISGTTTTYAYNGWGTLVQEQIQTGATITTTALILDERDGLPQVLGAIRSDGVTTLYAYGSEGVHAQQTRTASSAAIHYTLLDALGSIRALVTPAGAVARTIHYDAWGTVRHTTGTVATRLGYTGEWMGMVDGTVYLRARHYQPALGRFLQRDSFPGIPSSPQSLHKYTYAHNNPLKHTDPSGNVIPVLLAVGVLIAVAEFSLSVYDAYTTYETVMDPCISLGEKGLTIALFVGGLFLPGGGYASGAKAVGKSVKALVNNLDHADEVFDATYKVRKVFRNTDTAADTANGLDNADDANDLIKATNDVPCIKNSFVAGTLVKSEHGLVVIETLREGDRVWAVDPETGEAGYHLITWTTNHATEDIVTIAVTLARSPESETAETALTEYIGATAEHPFWVVGRGWVDAGDLQVGDILLAADGRRLVVTGVQPTIRHVQVYNFTVDTLHTYTVGRLATVVHNVECIDPSDVPTKPKVPTIDDSIDDFVGNSTPGNVSKSDQYSRVGDFSQANTDFDALVGSQPVKSHPGGIRSAEFDGNITISVRPNSSGGMPTIQINVPGKAAIKVRYDP